MGMSKEEFLAEYSKHQVIKKEKAKAAIRDIREYMVLNSYRIAKYRRTCPSNRGRYK